MQPKVPRGDSLFCAMRVEGSGKIRILSLFLYNFPSHPKSRKWTITHTKMTTLMSQEGSTNADNSTQQMILAAVKAQTEQAISACENRILEGIQKSVSEAVETKYKVVIAKLGADEAKKDSHLWQIVLAIIPIVLTVGLGWWVTRAQTEIVRRIDDQKQDLTTRLALTQEYQKRKLDVYQACAKSMSILADSLQPLRMDPKETLNKVSLSTGI